MPLTHADAIDKLSGTLGHLSKAKIAMDGAPDAMFGAEYSAAVASTRDQINGGLLAATTAIQAVLANETGERAIAVQASLLGPTVNEELRAREKRRGGGKKKPEADIPLRPTYQVYLFPSANEVYSVRFYPGENGPVATGLHGPWDYRQDDERSLEEQVSVLPHQSYDANPDLIAWFEQNQGDFQAIPGMAFPMIESEAEQQGEEAEQVAETVGTTS